MKTKNPGETGVHPPVEAQLDTAPHIKREEERQSPIVLIYRENNLFQTQIPTLLNGLRTMGRQVETVVFPASQADYSKYNWREVVAAEEESRRAKLAELAKNFDGKIIISDGTCQYDIKNSAGENIEPEANIDDLFITANNIAIFGEEASYALEGMLSSRDGISRERTQLEDCHQAVVRLLRRIFENSQNIPPAVFIAELKLNDHSPFREPYDRENGEREGRKYSPHEAAEYLKHWFVEAGLDANSTIIVPNLQSAIDWGTNEADVMRLQEADVKKMEQPGVWFIYDRHATRDIYDEFRQLRAYRVGANSHNFTMPLSNFVNDLKKAGLLTISQEELNAALEQLLNKKFGPEAQVKE